MFFTPGQQWAGSTEKLAYSEAGQTLASMNEWEASVAYLKPSRQVFTWKLLQRILPSPAM